MADLSTYSNLIDLIGVRVTFRSSQWKLDIVKFVI